MDTKYSKEFKEKIVTEYLSGGISYRELSKKCGVNFQQIQKWVIQFKNKHINNPVTNLAKSLPKEVKELQDELIKARLHNKLLEAMLDVGKDEFGIDLRKKPGTKQS